MTPAQAFNVAYCASARCLSTWFDLSEQCDNEAITSQTIERLAGILQYRAIVAEIKGGAE